MSYGNDAAHPDIRERPVLVQLEKTPSCLLALDHTGRVWVRPSLPIGSEQVYRWRPVISFFEGWDNEPQDDGDGA